MSNFTKICLPGAKMMHAEAQTDITKQRGNFCGLSNMSQNTLLLYIYFSSREVTGSLIFIGLCIVIYSYSTTNKMHPLSEIIYSCETLYMFRAVFPSIIRSSKLRIQQWYTSNSCCYLLLSGMRWNICLTYSVAVYAVLSS